LYNERVTFTYLQIKGLNQACMCMQINKCKYDTDAQKLNKDSRTIRKQTVMLTKLTARIILLGITTRHALSLCENKLYRAVKLGEMYTQ
jgi:hypothetical protein